MPVAWARALPLGQPIPPGEHSISVSLPSWSSNVGYQEGEKHVIDAMITGYPRFVVHRTIIQLAAIFVLEAGTNDERCLPFTTAKYADECRAYLAIRSRPELLPPRVRQVHLPSFDDGNIPTAPLFDLYAVFFHGSMFPLARQFWQHTGFGISSRMAQQFMDWLGPRVLSISPTQLRFLVPSEPSSPWGSDKPLSTSTNGNPLASAMDCNQERHDNHAITHPAALRPAKDVLRSRIAGLFARTERDPQNHIPHVNEDDVFLYPTGMTGIWHVYQLVMAMRPDTKSVCFGFPYTDTLKILQKWGPGCYFFGNPIKDIEELEALLASSPDVPLISALFCEFPSNPRLESPPLDRLRALADKYDFLIVVDDTIGTFANVDLLPFVDIIATSLRYEFALSSYGSTQTPSSKFFSGYGNVLGGSIVFNPRMRHYGALKATQIATYTDTYFEPDAITMEHNSRDFAARMRIINANTDMLCEFLRSRSLSVFPADKDFVIKEVFYPKWSTRESYEICRLKYYADGETAHDNFGGLFSLTFVSDLASHTFFDALPCAKGPTLGTNFTLACPYTILAHYAELDWAAGYGVDEGLVRISVGLEDHTELFADISFALTQAEDAVRKNRVE